MIASGSLQHIKELQGGTAVLDARRFRPNIYVENTADWSGFVEDAWVGGTLAVGETSIVLFGRALVAINWPFPLFETMKGQYLSEE